MLKASRAATGDFSINNISGAGRMDVVCRSLTAALWLSDKLRDDTIFYALLEGQPKPPKLLTFDPLKMKRFYPDERNIASHIRLALLGNQKSIKVEEISFKDFINQAKTQIVFLDKYGEDIRKVYIEDDVLFILGDDKGLSDEDREFLKDKSIKVSVGKKVYLSSQVISIVQNELDRRIECSK
ncbi:MAG: hypothetical protein QXM68_02740 [Candidatus Aenigmatarchaeota archaeon]|nr:hypothetical protein [Candidatus Aenigmarchaeota archaeon]